MQAHTGIAHWLDWDSGRRPHLPGLAGATAFPAPARQGAAHARHLGLRKMVDSSASSVLAECARPMLSPLGVAAPAGAGVCAVANILRSFPSAVYRI